MKLYSYKVFDNDLRAEQFEVIQNEVFSEGYKDCLYSYMFNEILENLSSQKENYSEKELEHAINYYAKEYEFLELKEDV